MKKLKLNNIFGFALMSSKRIGYDWDEHSQISCHQCGLFCGKGLFLRLWQVFNFFYNVLFNPNNFGRKQSRSLKLATWILGRSNYTSSAGKAIWTCGQSNYTYLLCRENYLDPCGRSNYTFVAGKATWIFGRSNCTYLQVKLPESMGGLTIPPLQVKLPGSVVGQTVPPLQVKLPGSVVGQTISPVQVNIKAIQ